jgi:hypothetical protein
MGLVTHTNVMVRVVGHFLPMIGKIHSLRSFIRIPDIRERRFGRIIPQ